jgi:hypothetical protein
MDFSLLTDLKAKHLSCVEQNATTLAVSKRKDKKKKKRVKCDRFQTNVRNPARHFSLRGQILF